MRSAPLQNDINIYMILWGDQECQINRLKDKSCKIECLLLVTVPAGLHTGFCWEVCVRTTPTFINKVLAIYNTENALANHLYYIILCL